MISSNILLRDLLLGMRSAYARGENVLAYARQVLNRLDNDPVATLVAYDLQAGSYIERVKRSPEFNRIWCDQIAQIISDNIPNSRKIKLLEVGCGEATTLQGVIESLGVSAVEAYGFDLSWSRIAEGNKWLEKNETKAKLFVADLFHIPLADNSMDIVYTSHSIEPNRGKELEAIRECFRVARHSVVLVEPIYELASDEARKRMNEHGYVKGLREVAESIGCEIKDYRLLKYVHNPLNPSGVIILKKNSDNKELLSEESIWQDPLGKSPMKDKGDIFFTDDLGLAYPVLRGIPLLKLDNAIVASKIN